MSNTDPGWPKFIRRMSAALNDSGSQTTAHQQTQQKQHPPPLPKRPPNHHLYQPKTLWIESEDEEGESSNAAPILPLRPTSISIQGLSQFMDEQQQAFDQAQRPARRAEKQPQRRTSLLRGGSVRRPAPAPASGVPDDDRPPTSDRVAEFRLAIPDGVRCMTQHPGDTVVGSVVVTVTKPTKAQRITVRFLGQQRVHLRDPSQTLSTRVAVDYTLFEKQLVLWGSAASDSETEPETMPPGTLTLPFSIALPRVNYPATVKCDRVCRVRYVVWAVFERPGTFVDHSVATAKEEIRFEPIAYPTRKREPLSIEATISKATDPADAPDVSVQLSGAISQLPVVPGDRLLYNLEATVVGEHPDKDYRVKRMRMVFVEKLKMRGLIRGQEHTTTHRTDIYSAKLVSAGTGKYASSVRVPLDMGQFGSKLLRRTYEVRIECDVTNEASLLGRMTRQKATFAAYVPLDVCDVSPDSFDSAALMNAYSDESRNIASFAIPSHDDAAAEPEICKGGWELERSYQKWNKHNDCWRELVRKAASTE
ncbi:hypothetical protein EV175_003280 [Coemansia sp. RSA 1933]|nr:hypothetical protein EV175_003280 [Coemansia sp. RSA 1933]